MSDIIYSLRKLALLGAIEQPIKISSGHFAEAIKSVSYTHLTLPTKRI